jgi:hypothetical protein
MVNIDLVQDLSDEANTGGNLVSSIHPDRVIDFFSGFVIFA